MTYKMTDLETLNVDAIPVFVGDEPTLRYDFTVTQELPAIELALLCAECQMPSLGPER